MTLKVPTPTTRLRMRALAAAATVSLALGGCALLPGADAVGVPLQLTGFIQSGGGDFTPPSDDVAAGVGAANILDSAAVLDSVGVDGVVLTGGGTGVNTPDAAALGALQIAQGAGLEGVLLVSNYDETLADFSPETAATLLGDPANIDAVATALGGFVTEQGWDGIMIDLESMTDAQAGGLTNFATALRAAVGPDVQLEIAVQAATDAAGYTALGFDLSALAGIVDHMTLMAYDQHGPFDLTQPGPVGSYDWQQEVLAAMLAVVPPEQVDLGIPTYGYVFGPDAGYSVSPAEARDLVAKAGVVATFDETAREWTATLSEGTVIWWADLQSLGTRLDLARTEGLHGAAVWSLDLGDPLAP